MDFTNRIINSLNFHTALQRFSTNIFDVFGAVYLLTLGMSFPNVSLTWASSCILRSLLRPLALKLSEIIGLKRALILGIIVNSGLFFALYKVNGLNNWLYFFIFYLSLCDVAYWLPYHAYYSVAGDISKRGRQVGTQLGFITIFKMIAPLVGGLMITRFGFLALYITATVVMFISIIPLIFVQDLAPGEPLNLKEALKRVDKKGFVMQIGDGVLYIHTFIWTIVLFYLVKNYVMFGGLITFELFSTTLLCFLLGYLIDKGKGVRITCIGLLIIGTVIILRAFLIKTIPEIIVSDILIAFGMIFYSVSFDVGFYNMAKQTPNTLWFHFFGELGWDIGAATSLTLSAILFILGIPLQFIIIFSFIGLFIIYGVLIKNYTRNPSPSDIGR